MHIHDAVRAEAARILTEEARQLAEQERVMRDQQRDALELIRQAQDRQREAAETARAASEHARLKADVARDAAMESVQTAAVTLKNTLDQMAIVEELRRTLRDMREPKLGSS